MMGLFTGEREPERVVGTLRRAPVGGLKGQGDRAGTRTKEGGVWRGHQLGAVAWQDEKPPSDLLVPPIGQTQAQVRARGSVGGQRERRSYQRTQHELEGCRMQVGQPLQGARPASLSLCMPKDGKLTPTSTFKQPVHL